MATALMFTGAYDLEYWQPSFTILEFVMEFTAKRGKRKQARVDILPGVRGEFGPYKYWPSTLKACRGWRDNLVVPVLYLMWPRAKVCVLKERPKDLSSYDYMLPQGWTARPYYDNFAKGLRPFRPPCSRLVKAKHVTITLRESGGKHWAQRDSNLRAWVEAGRLIERETRRPVLFIRDTDKADEPLAGARTVPAAAKLLNERAQLYAEAALNMGVSNGPIWFALAMDAPVIVFKPATENAGKSHGVEFVKAQWGISHGEQLRGAGPHQRLVWKDDSDPRTIADAAIEFLA